MRYKRTIRVMAVTLAMLAAALSPMGAHAEDIFSELTKSPQVESTYVSGRFAHNQKYWYSSDGQHSINLSRGFSAMYAYQCYSEESVSKARRILENYLKKNPDIEVVMKTTQGLQEYTVFERFLDDGKVTQMIIWSSDSPNTCDIAVIDWNKGLDRGEKHYSE